MSLNIRNIKIRVVLLQFSLLGKGESHKVPNLMNETDGSTAICLLDKKERTVSVLCYGALSW